ncbi:MAG: helix-hairpin-helix domain-containing protein [Candidatus Pacearchaeota archaeon]
MDDINEDMSIEGTEEEASQDEDKTDLNIATKEELMTIPGINERIAASIIKHREQNGQFKNFDELSKIKDLKRENIKTLQKWARI